MDNREFYYQQNLEALAQAEDSYLDEVAEIDGRPVSYHRIGYEAALAKYQKAVAEITHRLQPSIKFAQVMSAIATLFNHGYNLSSNDDNSSHKIEAVKYGKPATYGGQKRIAVLAYIDPYDNPVCLSLEIRQNRDEKEWYGVVVTYSGNKWGCRATTRVTERYPLRILKAKMSAFLIGKTEAEVKAEIQKITGPSVTEAGY